MTVTASGRRVALTVHITCSVGWLGAAAAYFALAIAALTSGTSQAVRAAYLTMELVAKFAILPFAFAAVLTGLLSSLVSPWGLFRHYWVIFKLLLSVVATIVLLANMSAVRALAGMAAETEAVGHGGLISQILHAGGGLLVLLVNTTLGVWKPRGMTRYGWRKQQLE